MTVTQIVSRFPMAMLLLLLTAGGCVRTIDPVLKDEQVIVDDSLAGRWVSEDGKESIEVTQANEHKQYNVLYTDEKGKNGRFVVRLGKIGEILVAETRPEEPKMDASEVYLAHLVPAHSFLVIRQTAPQLKMAAMSADWLEKYVEKHPGELQVRKMGLPLVTASTAEFQAFLLRHWKDEGALNDLSPLVRQGPAPVPAQPR